MIRAAVLNAPNAPISVEGFSEPELRSGEILLKTIYSEVCGTDVHLKNGRLADVPYPIIPGHFCVGVAEKVYGQVRTVAGQHVLEGDVITFLDVHGTCHRCWSCLVDKAVTKCPSRRVYGVNHSTTDGLLGGWAEKVLIQSDVAVAHLPAGVTPLRFIAGGCALPTGIHAVERARVGLGDLVVIQGAGPVGICAGIAAYRSGAEDIYIAEKSAARLQAARDFGFKVIALDADSKNSTEAFANMTNGRKADVVIEASGTPVAIQQGFDFIRDGGRYAIAGHYTNAGDIPINPHLNINKKHLEILGTWGIEYSHFHKALALMSAGVVTPSQVPLEKIVTKSYKLSEADEALRDVEKASVVKAVIIPSE